ncbi:MAG: ABC transporter ATP-binding protein [Planctomycetales bacterium]
MQDALVRLVEVGRTFPMGDVSVEVLRGVSLDIRRGEMLVIVGPSGSGKTTMLNLIGGLDQPTVGEVWVDGLELSKLGRRELSAFRRRSVGFVFQFYNLIPNLTAHENVMVAAELSDNPLDVAETLRLVDLQDRASHFPSQMSGGEQQRVAIARALIKNPTLLLCDEPTGALDFVTGKKVLGLLRHVNRTMGQTVIIITHNAAISRMADRVARIRSGEIVEDAVNENPLSPEEIAW